MDIQKINSEQWFKDRIGKIIWKTRVECECVECSNAYVNGIMIVNEFNADGLFRTLDEEKTPDYPIIYFDTWKERNKFEEVNRKEPKKEVINYVERLNDILKRNEWKKITKRNDTCPCGSGIKYKKCCLKLN